MFEELNKIECKIEKKGQFTYVSWTDAWTEIKKRHEKAVYKIYENSNGFPCFFNENGGMVKVGVTIDGLEYINWMPILDYNNKPVVKDKIDVFQINKAIQRSFVKAIAMHGLGLYVYRGEDLPESETKEEAVKKSKSEPLICEVCKIPISAKVMDFSIRKYSKPLCLSCQDKAMKEGYGEDDE